MKRKAVRIKRGKGMQYKLFAVDEKNVFVFGLTFDDDITSAQITEIKYQLEKVLAEVNSNA